MISMAGFKVFLIQNVNTSTIMKTRELSFYTTHIVMITIIADSYNIWGDTTNPTYRNIYLFQYATLPTNIKLSERGVK